MANFVFHPQLGLTAIFYKKLKAVLFWLVVLILGSIGIWGLFSSFRVFSATLLADMFLLYLFSRKSFEKISSAGEADVALFLDKDSSHSLDQAWKIAYENGYRFVRPIHLFIAFLDIKGFKKVLKRLNCRLESVADKAYKILENASDEGGLASPQVSSELETVFVAAYLLCLHSGQEQVGFLELLWAMSEQKNLVRAIFDEFGISAKEIERAVRWAGLEKEIRRRERKFFWNRLFKPKGRLNRAMTAASTPFLNRVSQDLTLMARQGQFEMVVGREKEIAEVFNLFASGQTGVVLVGPNESGKKSVLKKIAQMMVEEDVPKFLQDKRLVKLNIGSLLSMGGEGSRVLENIIFEVSRAGNIILVVENIDGLIGLGGYGRGWDMAEMLASALYNRTFFFIGTSSEEDFFAKIEGKRLGEFLNKVVVALPNRELLWQIAITKTFVIEKELKVLFSVDAVDEAINLADRYFYGKNLSVTVMELLKEAAIIVRNRPEAEDNFVRERDVTDLVAGKVDVPLGEVQSGEKEKLLHLEDLIHQWVIDQEEAVGAVANALRRNRLNLQDLKRPVCNFLFVGPTGVGKTELAKALARVYFGDVKKMIRLDMSEYQEKRSLRQLIGHRTDEGVQKGFLTEAIKRQPYSLLLLDEIEKAHPDILNLFLQVMDDGRITDVKGNTINCTNIILIATSNAATQFVQEKIKEGTDYTEIYRQLTEQALLEYFRPEFLNRFDKIVLFKSLSMGDLIQITQLLLNGVKEQLGERGIALEVTDGAVQELTQLGFNPLYGARALRRIIQDKVENEVARMVLEDKVKRRDSILLKEGLVFEIQKAKEL